jgi:protein-disulfide isomerase
VTSDVDDLLNLERDLNLQGTMAKLIKRIIRSIIICSLGMGMSFCQIGDAQDSAATENLKQDLSDLKKEVMTVGAAQQQIIRQLTEITQLLAANAAMRQRPRPQTPPSSLATQDESFRGQSGASVAIVEYADFECPYCGQYEHDVYPEISRDYIQTGKVKYFYRDLPLPMHPHAIIAARAAHCAGEQGKYWEMHDSLFAKQNALRDVDMPDRAQEVRLDTAKFSDCLSSNRYKDEIKQSAMEAEKMGIQTTPTFFIGAAGADGEVRNLKMIIGARPYDDFKSVIDGLLSPK